MGEYAVTGVRKDNHGEITTLCGPWGSSSSVSVMQAIQLGHRYYVPMMDSSKSWIRIVNGPRHPYLRTDWDKTTKNNLEELPLC